MELWQNVETNIFNLYEGVFQNYLNDLTNCILTKYVQINYCQAFMGTVYKNWSHTSICFIFFSLTMLNFDKLKKNKQTNLCTPGKDTLYFLSKI